MLAQVVYGMKYLDLHQQPMQNPRCCKGDASKSLAKTRMGFFGFDCFTTVCRLGEPSPPMPGQGEGTGQCLNRVHNNYRLRVLLERYAKGRLTNGKEGDSQSKDCGRGQSRFEGHGLRWS